MQNFLHVSLSALILVSSSLISSARDTVADSVATSSPAPRPEQWTYSPEATMTLPDEDEWWHSFRDWTLDSLMQVGIANNYNLLQAGHRREMARLAVKTARSGYYPTVGMSAGYERTYESRTSSNNYSLGATAQWEVDLFGRIASQVKSKKAAYHASRADYVASMVSICSDIATYYIKYRVVQQQILVAQEHLENQARVLRITEARHEAGLVSKLDVTQARTVYLSTKASIPPLETQQVQTLNALAVMLGVHSSDLLPALNKKHTLPSYDQIVPSSVPADLLRRRPDVVAAEAQLAVYAAQLGMAKKEFLPTLTLEGNIGWESPRASHMIDSDHLAWSVAPRLSWTLFDGLSRKYAVSSAKEQMLIGVDSYNLTMLNAYAEVENAMAAYKSATETLDINREILTQSHESFDLSMEQYKQGLTSFTDVVSAQIDWLNSANTLVSAHGDAIIALIDLYKSLGGSY